MSISLVARKDVGIGHFGNLFHRTARVLRDSDWGEYIVKFYKDGEYQEDADYHTDDKQDAIGTASAWVTKQEVDHE